MCPASTVKHRWGSAAWHHLCGLLQMQLHHSLCLAKAGGECQGQAILGRFPHYRGHYDLKFDVLEPVAALMPFWCQYRQSWSCSKTQALGFIFLVHPGMEKMLLKNYNLKTGTSPEVPLPTLLP